MSSKITNDGTKISFRLDNYTAEKLKTVAKSHYQSVSAYIRQQINQSIIKEYENNGKK